VSHHLDCLAVDCEWRASEVWKYIHSIQGELANRTRVASMREAVERLEALDARRKTDEFDKEQA
jgi:hypothetical protein